MRRSSKLKFHIAVGFDLAHGRSRLVDTTAMLDSSDDASFVNEMRSIIDVHSSPLGCVPTRREWVQTPSVDVNCEVKASPQGSGGGGGGTSLQPAHSRTLGDLSGSRSTSGSTANDDTDLFEVRTTHASGLGVFAAGCVPVGATLRFWGRSFHTQLLQTINLCWFREGSCMNAERDRVIGDSHSNPYLPVECMSCRAAWQ